MYQPWLTRHSTVMMKHGVMSLTTGRVSTGIRQEVLLHWRNMAKEETGATEIYVMSSAAGLKTGVRSPSTLNRSSVKKWTMITMVPIMTNLNDSILLKGVQCRRSHGFFPRHEEGALAPEHQTIGDRDV
jgi:hypothetical protein